MSTKYRSADAEGYANPTARAAIARATNIGRMTVEEYKRLAPAKPSKYRNRWVTTPDGIFQSQHEANRYAELKLLQGAGAISELRRQVKFPLIGTQRDVGGKVIERAMSYYADFVYMENGERVVEDAKSEITRRDKTYIAKRKLMLAVHGIRVREV